MIVCEIIIRGIGARQFPFLFGAGYFTIAICSILNRCKIIPACRSSLFPSARRCCRILRNRRLRIDGRDFPRTSMIYLQGRFRPTLLPSVKRGICSLPGRPGVSFLIIIFSPLIYVIKTSEAKLRFGGGFPSCDAHLFS